jgi:hypothetical protein
VDQLVVGYFTVNGMSIIRQSQDLPTQPFKNIHRIGCVCGAFIEMSIFVTICIKSYMN